MDKLNDQLSRVRERCAEFQIYKSAAHQVSLRATQAVAFADDIEDEEEDIASVFLSRLIALFATFVGDSAECIELDALDVLMRRQIIHYSLEKLWDGIRILLLSYQEHISFNSKKWTKEWETAANLDEIFLTSVAFTVASSPHLMFQAQALSDIQIDDLCSLFETASIAYPPADQLIIRNALSSLRTKSGDANVLTNMTGRIRLLGDTPMFKGVLADFWLAGTSSGNMVTAKILRGYRARDANEGKCAHCVVLPLLREAKISSHFAHPNVLPTLGFALLKDSLAIITPYMRNGNLNSYLSRTPGADKLQLAYEIAQGMAYIHSCGVVHGNLNSNSILISEKGSAVISSFMFSERLSSDSDSDSDAMNPNPELSEDYLQHIRFDWKDINDNAAYTYPYIGTSVDIRYLSLVLSRLLAGRTIIQFTASDARARRAGSLPPLFIPDSPFREEIWDLLCQCAQAEVQHNKYPHARALEISARKVVERLGDIIRRRDALAEEETAGKTATPRRNWSLSSDQSGSSDSSTGRDGEKAVSLPDLSAEIRRTDILPVTGGGFCDIWIGERLGKEKVALKVLKMFGVPEQIRRRFLAEATIWSQFRHENILDFYGICDNGSSISMVSPWLENSNVLRYCTTIEPNANRLKLLNDAAAGLLYLHTRSNPIVHGDLKCANILVKDNGTACLCDFGLSKIHQEVTSQSLRDAGSQRFMAPELFNAWENDELPGKTLASDCYAMGQVIVELLSGERPMSEIAYDHLVYPVIFKGYKPKRPDTAIARQWLIDPVWSLVLKMTAHAKERRPTMQEVTPQLRSFWIMSTFEVPEESSEGTMPDLSKLTLSQGRYVSAGHLFDDTPDVDDTADAVNVQFAISVHQET